jgi:murein DD-endopeptidase MepM/ murein hydrolase activator NlpD
VAVWRTWWRWGAVASLVVVVGCGLGSGSLKPTGRGEGIYHQVKRGENLYRIGKAYGVSHVELARANGIADAGRLEIGQRIFVPGGRRSLPVNVITPERAVTEALAENELPRGEGVFIWPLKSGTLTSSFGPRGRSFHDGIDIGAAPGTPVRAARDGAVIYSDTLRGYGNVVIVQHEGGYATVYAHNEENLVAAGSRVRQGQAVARVGRSGRTSGPNLHFEIRKDNIARNPIYFLPSQTVQRAKDSPT